MGNPVGPSPRDREPRPANPGRAVICPLHIGIKIMPSVRMGAPRLGSELIHGIAMDHANKRVTPYHTSRKRGRSQPREPPLVPEK